MAKDLGSLKEQARTFRVSTLKREIIIVSKGIGQEV